MRSTFLHRSSICGSNFSGAWGPQVPDIGFDIFRNESAAKCQLQYSTSLSPRWRQGYVKAPFQLWLFAEAMFQQVPSDKFVFQMRCS